MRNLGQKEVAAELVVEGLEVGVHPLTRLDLFQADIGGLVGVAGGVQLEGEGGKEL